MARLEGVSSAPAERGSLFVANEADLATPALARSAVDRHLYFVHALDEDTTSVTLPELHQIMRDYINRNEDEMAELAREREQRNSWRRGEGKNKREMELEKLMVEDEAEYRAGFGKYTSTVTT